MLYLCGMHAQNESTAYRNFPIVISLHFHSLNMPFRNIGAGFANPGIGIGTEVSLGGKDRWVQQFHAVWYRNKAAGNGFFLNTQTTWRPEIADDIYGEVKLGAGYMLSRRPTPAFRPSGNAWNSVGRKGNGMFTILTGIGAGYEHRESDS
jgi:hypothetical protein